MANQVDRGGSKQKWSAGSLSLRSVQLDAEPYHSSLLISFPLYGSHASVAYSVIGLTREVYTSDLTSGGGGSYRCYDK